MEWSNSDSTTTTVNGGATTVNNSSTIKMETGNGPFNMSPSATNTSHTVSAVQEVLNPISMANSADPGSDSALVKDEGNKKRKLVLKQRDFKADPGSDSALVKNEGNKKRKLVLKQGDFKADPGSDSAIMDAGAKKSKLVLKKKDFIAQTGVQVQPKVEPRTQTAPIEYNNNETNPLLRKLDELLKMRREFFLEHPELEEKFAYSPTPSDSSDSEPEPS